MRYALGLSLYAMSCIAQQHETPQIHWEQVNVALRLVEDQSVRRGGWRGAEAALFGNFETTTVSLKVEEIVHPNSRPARFYGEVFDRSGRLCFPVAFIYFPEVASDDQNLASNTRKLYATASGLAPATEPVELRLYALDGPSPNRVKDFITPITVLDVTPDKMAYLANDLAPRNRTEPVTDLVLAEVSVDKNGKATNVRLLRVWDRRAETWFTRFAAGLRFSAQTRGGSEPEDATSLVLIRLLALQDRQSVPAYASWTDPWVREYAASLADGTAPVVNELKFQPESYSRGDATQTGPPWSFVSLGTVWCDDALRLDWNPTLKRKEWRWNLNGERPKLTLQPRQ